MKRIFFAVDTSAEAKTAASERISSFRAEFADVRVSWVRPENLHITLKFIGDADDRQIEKLSSRLADSFRKIEPLTASLASPSAFGKRVLSIAIEDDMEALRSVNEILETVCESAGFPREKRSFKPHLTLARIRDERGTRELIAKHAKTQIKPVEWLIREIVLYESELRSTGSVYSKLKIFPLGIA